MALVILTGQELSQTSVRSNYAAPNSKVQSFQFHTKGDRTGLETF